MASTGRVIFDLPRADYDALPGVNWSTLKAMGRSAQHYRAGLERKGEDRPALALGRAVHVAVLEPDLFSRQYAVWTGGRRAGGEWQRFVEAHAGLEILTESDAELCASIASAVGSHPVAGRYVRGGQAEVTVTWQASEPDAGELPGWRHDCKGRLDYLLPDAIVDLKTTRDASQDSFGREAWTYRYHTQAAYYRDGYRAATGRRLPYFLIAAEKEPPFVVQVYSVPEVYLDLGRDEYRGHLAHLAWCQRHGEWPGYSDGELELVLPRWATGIDPENDLSDLDLEIA